MRDLCTYIVGNFVDAYLRCVAPVQIYRKISPLTRLGQLTRSARSQLLLFYLILLDLLDQDTTSRQQNNVI